VLAVLTMLGPSGLCVAPRRCARCSLRSQPGQLLCAAAVRGQGIALLPTFIAGADLQEGSLRSILTDYAAPEISIYAIYPETRHLSVKVRVFIDFLTDASVADRIGIWSNSGRRASGQHVGRRCGAPWPWAPPRNPTIGRQNSSRNRVSP